MEQGSHQKYFRKSFVRSYLQFLTLREETLFIEEDKVAKARVSLNVFNEGASVGLSIDAPARFPNIVTTTKLCFEYAVLFVFRFPFPNTMAVPHDEN